MKTKLNQAEEALLQPPFSKNDHVPKSKNALHTWFETSRVNRLYSPTNALALLHKFRSS